MFSRVFPVGEANPHLHPLWQTAEQFGAVCTNTIDDQVTHVVANSLGTDKVIVVSRIIVFFFLFSKRGNMLFLFEVRFCNLMFW